MAAKKRYLIGIDLGTTNSSLAYSSIEETAIEQMLIPQIVAAGEEGEKLLLPSFLYFPLPEEQKASETTLGIQQERPFCIGSYAQQRGLELPARLISSAKSWLCHTGIDRRARFLPLAQGEKESVGIEKKSPLEVCADILSHLRKAWQKKMPEAPFDQQAVFITVPASFDPSARELVLEAAQLAGYPDVVLLEEPQSAFYAWLDTHKDTWRDLLKVGDRILVIDIGGGTTDFSLIGVQDDGGDLALERLAVGSHLLLGGDNIDLSLAYMVKGKLEEKGHVIDDWQVQALIHQCRQAKELLLSDNPPKSVDITIMGRGSRLIGGSLKAKITLEETSKLILDGFAPLVEREERSPAERLAGLKQVGLPYAKDARLTCQLAKFLSMTGESDTPSMDSFVMPTAVLFNGGTTKAEGLQKRLVQQLNKWAEALGKPPVAVLPGADYDFAVSRGAVNYGKAISGSAIRIKSGTSCSYFIGIEDAMPAIPGIAPPLKAFCIVPFGMEEGTELDLASQEFALVVGEPATFRFFSHNTQTLSDGTVPSMGAIVKNYRQELKELPPIEAHLNKAEGDGKVISVCLRSKVTEVGMLELWCVAQDGRKWKLEFNIRGGA